MLLDGNTVMTVLCIIRNLALIMCRLLAVTCDDMLRTERPHLATYYLDMFMYTCDDVHSFKYFDSVCHE